MMEPFPPLKYDEKQGNTLVGRRKFIGEATSTALLSYTLEKTSPNIPIHRSRVSHVNFLLNEEFRRR